MSTRRALVRREHVQRTACPTFGDLPSVCGVLTRIESDLMRLDLLGAAKYRCNMNSLRASFIGLTVVLLAGSIALAQTPAAKSSASSKAIAVLHPTAGNKVSGTVTFTPVADGVQVHAEITGLTAGKHGFHVHEFGDCSAADLSSAGGHFNPTGQPHAGPEAAERHEGDMGNVEADALGNAKLDYVDHQISLSNDDKSVIGRSVVVHAKPDDLKSQPSGDSGARIACGVIGWAKTQ
jgi:Cu-Zn family superoxide dismutase